MVRTLPLQSETRPELPRILAIAAAIAVHAFVFMLLLIPMATPPVRMVISDGIDAIWIERKKEVIEEVVIKKDPKPVTEPKTTPRISDPTEPVDNPPVIVEGGTVATSNSVIAEPGPVADQGPVDTGPVSVGSLAYVTATAPPYPRAEVRAGIGGTVILKVLVDTDGRPLEVVVLEGSGNRNLDRSAREHVLKHWLFQPAMRDGKAVQAYGKVPVVFSMQ